MNNVFQRNISMESLRDKDIADYTPSELVAYLTTRYPNDPIGALTYLRETYRVDDLLGKQTELLLEGIKRVKAN